MCVTTRLAITDISIGLIASSSRVMRVLATLLLGSISGPLWGQVHPAIVISQVYGGGGNSGASYRNDFIELFNRGNSAVDITGWTVQYASASGDSWDRTVLSGVVQAGRYYLVQEIEGNAGTTSLPRPDASGALSLSATSGKVAVVSDGTVLNVSAPSGNRIVDFVGYGQANAAEGSPTAVLTNTTAALRRSGGCTDSGNNSADFSVGSPAPRNSSSSRNLCSPVGPQITQLGVVNAASYSPGAVAPGEIVTIFGSGLGPAVLTTLQLTADRQFVTTALAGTRVLFDGIPAPLVYTKDGQVSAIVPYAIADRAESELRVEYAGILSNTIRVAVAQSVPAIFTADSSGKGPAAVLNQNYSVNGAASPAERGSVITLYASGGGLMIPATGDGRVTGADLSSTALPVTVLIGGAMAEVLYAGTAPQLVSGVLQVNARIPETLAASGLQSLSLRVGGAGSPTGVNVFVGGTTSTGGTATDIETRYLELKREAVPERLPEIPNDLIGLPQNWLGLISWNTQVGGTSTTAGAARPPMVKYALNRMFGGTYQILAAQEVPSAESAELLRTQLPDGTAQWQAAFTDTTDTMDNGFWYRTGITLRDHFPLFVSGQKDASGRVIADSSRALHPPHVAQFEAGDFDFTLITVHLTFADGDTRESARELRNVFDYLDWYFSQPDHDPDVMVCGDFNTPSALSGQKGVGGLTLESVLDGDSRFGTGERRFVSVVHQPTSRSPASSGGAPANNYDHCLLSIGTLKEFIQGRRVDTTVLTDHPDDPEVRLTSDHFPIVMLFRTRGPGVALDRKTRIRMNVDPLGDAAKQEAFLRTSPH